ncbi:MAG: alpha/beta hydrolase fold domain-containing protein, partial [Clostridiales bacterium]|nr:alpha/beta hydrolase fold domain-containing protein [Clostridiales bacterium]
MKNSPVLIYTKAYNVAAEHIFGYTLYAMGGSKNVNFTKKIRYCDDKKLYLYICHKKGREEEKLPVFVYIHGGGFVSGMPDARKAIISNIAERGFAVVGIYYGLAPEYHF